MAKKKEEVSKEIPELNLGPIMNMVVILIPLLLLSVVFTEVGVINITAPKMAMGPSTAPPTEDKEPLNLTVTIEEGGLRVSAGTTILAPVGNCPKTEGAPTICLKDQTANVATAFANAVKNLKGNDAEKKIGSEEMKKTVNLYDWRLLYNTLYDIKKSHPDETVINISATPVIPYSMVIRLMDVSRYKLEKGSYENDTAFWEANYAKDGDSYAALFPDPVLTVAR